MRLFPWKRKPWFSVTISIEKSDSALWHLMFPAENWLQGSFWWERLQAATPRERVAMLIGALAANERERDVEQ